MYTLHSTPIFHSTSHEQVLISLNLNREILNKTEQEITMHKILIAIKIINHNVIDTNTKNE